MEKFLAAVLCFGCNSPETDGSGTLRSLEQTRDALSQAMQVAASASDRSVPDALPKPAGMPMLDVSEISKKL